MHVHVIMIINLKIKAFFTCKILIVFYVCKRNITMFSTMKGNNTKKGIKTVFILFVLLFYHPHHHVVPPAQISLTLSCHFSLSFIAAFARLYEEVHRSTLLMSSSLLLQQCPACLVRLTWIVFVMGVCGRIVGTLWGVASRTCSILLTTFLCNCRLAFSPAVLLASKT